MPAKWFHNGLHRNFDFPFAMQHKYRPGHVSFAQSMQMVTLVSTLAEVARVVSAQMGRLVTPEELSFEDFGRDERNGWRTWVVYLADYGPVGFSTGCLDPSYTKASSRWGALEEEFTSAY